METLSFNKRIALTKKEVFEGIQAADMDKTANCKAGYYSLKSIVSILNPIMDKHNVDLELNIEKTQVTILWIDCESEKIRTSVMDTSAIEGIERLPSMSNLVQSMGACLTYQRRYAYTLALNLNATDLIENATGTDKYGADNKSGNATPPAATPADLEDAVTKRTRLQWILFYASDKTKEGAEGLLAENTAFKGKDNKEVAGLTMFAKVAGKRLDVTLSKCEKAYPEAVKLYEDSKTK